MLEITVFGKEYGVVVLFVFVGRTIFLFFRNRI